MLGKQNRPLHIRVCVLQVYYLSQACIPSQLALRIISEEPWFFGVCVVQQGLRFLEVRNRRFDVGKLGKAQISVHWLLARSFKNDASNRLKCKIWVPPRRKRNSMFVEERRTARL